MNINYYTALEITYLLFFYFTLSQFKSNRHLNPFIFILYSNTYIDAQRSGMPLISRTEEVAVYSDRSYKKFEQVSFWSIGINMCWYCGCVGTEMCIWFPWNEESSLYVCKNGDGDIMWSVTLLISWRDWNSILNPNRYCIKESFAA